MYSYSQACPNPVSSLISKLLDILCVDIILSCNCFSVEIERLQLFPHFFWYFTQPSCFSVHYRPRTANLNYININNPINI